VHGRYNPAVMLSASALPSSPKTLRPHRPLRPLLHSSRSHSQLRSLASSSDAATSVIVAPTTPITATPPAPNTVTARTQTNGLRAQLRHLLPRHALFHVRVHIHQLSSVPLLHGEFCLRWKFKNVHAVPGSTTGLFGLVSTRAKGKGREKGESENEGSLHGNQGSPPGSRADTLETSTIHSTESDSHSIPSVTVSDYHASDSPSSNKAPSEHIPDTLGTDSTGTSSLSASTPIESYAAARGMTEYVKLKEHKVTWEHTVDVVVKMDVDRDSLDLLPNELKLVVMQVRVMKVLLLSFYELIAGLCSSSSV
jgi:hypothetical protein